MLGCLFPAPAMLFVLNAIEKTQKVFDQVEERYPYYDFLKLYCTKEHGEGREGNRTVNSEWDGFFLWG